MQYLVQLLQVNEVGLLQLVRDELFRVSLQVGNELRLVLLVRGAVDAAGPARGAVDPAGAPGAGLLLGRTGGREEAVVRGQPRPVTKFTSSIAAVVGARRCPHEVRYAGDGSASGLREMNRVGI